LIIAVLFQTAATPSQAQEAPGGPGAQGTWARPDKQGFLTTRDTPVWATIADGVVSEISYPSIDHAQTRDTKIAMLLFDGRTLVEDVDFTHVVTRLPGTLAFHVSSKGGDFFY
jgi:glucoamylase